MASSKSYSPLFCALLALVLLVSAELTTSHDAKEASDKNAKVDHHGGPGYGGYPGGGHGGYGGDGSEGHKGGSPEKLRCECIRPKCCRQVLDVCCQICC